MSFGDVMHPSIQGDSGGGGNGLSQRMTSTQQAVRQVGKGLSFALPLSRGLMRLFSLIPASLFVNLT